VESSQPGKNEVLVELIPLEGTTGVFGGLPISLLLIRGVSATFSPEVEECGLQMAQRLLSWNTRHVIQPFCFLLFFEIGEQCRSVIITDSFLFGSPGFRSKMKCPVVDVSAATKDFGKFLGLGVGRIESKAVSGFHTINLHYVS